jgi:ABC-2 type transport system ATP-binding protein
MLRIWPNKNESGPIYAPDGGAGSSPLQAGAGWAIEVDAAIKTYGKGEALVHALRGVSLKVATGQTMVLIGPNGAGKSTLVDLLVGLKKPDSGSVTVLGRDIVCDPRAHSERIGVQFQNTSLFARLTVADYFQFFGALYTRTVDPVELARRLGLQDQLHKKVHTLSGGYRQRLALALALINDPDLIFLDEPTTGLDPIVRREFLELIHALRKDGKTILLSTHYMEEAHALADRIVMISHGLIIAEGSAEGIIALAGPNCTNLDDAYAHFAKNAEREHAR